MDYTLEYYDEKYLERQFEIGNTQMITWLGAQQSSVDKLRAAYSKEGVDPQTKMYALHKDRVVGFLTSGISEETATMSLPLVEQGHEAAASQLIEFAFDTLRSKGVTEVGVNASPGWGNTMEYVTQFGFEEAGIQWWSARLDINDFPLELGETSARDVLPTDDEQLLQILQEHRGMDVDQAQAQLDLLRDISDRVLSWKVIVDNGKIMAHDHLVQDIRDPNKARMNPIFCQNETQRDQIMIEHVRAAKRQKVRYIDTFFFGSWLDKHPEYEKYGFEITHVTKYSKSL